MKRFVEGEDRRQGALLPHCLDDYVTENNPVRVIEAFIDELDLATLGFDGVVPETTGRPAYHPATLLQEHPRCSHARPHECCLLPSNLGSGSPGNRATRRAGLQRPARQCASAGK